MAAMRDIRSSREEKRRSDAKWQGEKKIQELKIKGLEHEMSPGMLDLALKTHKLKFNKIKAESELKEHELRQAEMPIKEQAQRYAQGYQELQEAAQRFGPDFLSSSEFEYNGFKFNPSRTGDFTASQQRNIKSEKSNVLQAIETGKVWDPKYGGVLDVETEDDLLAYASHKKVDAADPDIKAALDAKFRGSAAPKPLTKDQEELVARAQKVWPNKSKEEITKALRDSKRLGNAKG